MSIIDIHAHFKKWPFFSEVVSLADVRKLLDKFDIEKCIFSSAKGIMYDIGEGNAELAEFLKEDERFYGAIVVNPNYVEESMQELKRYAPEANFVAVKNHPNYTGQPINSPHNLKIIPRILEYDLPMLVHTMGKAATDAAADVAARFPQLKIFLIHMGIPDWQYAIERVKGLANVFLETASSYADRRRIEKAVEVLGAERIFFGTDLTLLNPAYILGMIKEADLSDDARDKILRANAERVFHFLENCK